MANTWQHLSNKATTCHAEDIAIHAKWQIDGNVFCFNIYIDLLVIMLEILKVGPKKSHSLNLCR